MEPEKNTDNRIETTVLQEVKYVPTTDNYEAFKPETEVNKVNNRFCIFVLVTVGLLATSGEITMTWTSPMLSKLYSNDSSINPLPQPITKEQDAMIASLINVGAIIGGVPFVYVSEQYGRKIALLGAGVFHSIAYLTMAFAKDVKLFYFGRFIGGLGVGAGYTLLPMYVAEIAEENRRGSYSVALLIFWSFGNFSSYLIGPFLSSKVFNLVNFCFPLAFLIMFSLIGTETPFYLAGAKKIDKAEKVLMRLRSKSTKEVQAELKQIIDTLEKENVSGVFKSVCTNPGIRKAFIISISLIVIQQLTGWSAITFYMQPIFEASRTNLPPEISSIIAGAVFFSSSLPAPFVAHKFGRKTLLLFSSVSVGCCLVLLGGFFFIQTRTDMDTAAISWIPLTSLPILTMSFELGYACVPWTISSEIFPNNIKKLSATATASACFTTAFFITQFFNDLSEILGIDGVFFMFAFFTFASAAFTIFYVPETRGKTFIEIQQLLQK